MGFFELVNVNHEYVDFLRSDPALSRVMTTKYTESTNGGRKYIGLIFTINEMEYFVPIHTGRKEEKSRNCVSTYSDGRRKIIRSKFDIYRIRTDTNGNEFLETVIKCAYMIPISKNDVIPYSIRLEPDLVKKTNFQNLYKWIKIISHQTEIINRCNILYTKKV